MLTKSTPTKDNRVSSVVITNIDKLEGWKSLKNFELDYTCLEAAKSKNHEKEIFEKLRADKSIHVEYDIVCGCVAKNLWDRSAQSVNMGVEESVWFG